MDTYFASPDRTLPEILKKEIDEVSQHKVIETLLKSVSGLFAVLDGNRQILAVNDTLLKMMKLGSAENVLGLRAGEALHCRRVKGNPNGCGTGRFCSSCGMAISTVATIGGEEPVERSCVLSTELNGKTEDICLSVKAAPFEIDSNRFILLFLQDQTESKMLASMEKIFYHDIGNSLNALVGISSFLEDDHPQDELVQMLSTTVDRIKKDIAVQKTLSSKDESSYLLRVEEVTVLEFMKDLKDFFSKHAIANSRDFSVINNTIDTVLKTDYSLLFRSTVNLLTNAFEASSKSSTVVLKINAVGNEICFNVWSDSFIEETIQLRIFQKYFTTSADNGRGLGTYAVKLFTEEYLKGKVSFTTSNTDGTTFTLRIPKVLT